VRAEQDLDLGEKLARFALMHGVTGAEEVCFWPATCSLLKVAVGLLRNLNTTFNVQILREAGLSSAPSAETSSHVTTGVPPAKSEAKCGPDSDTFA
jgi:hypothetical protein